MKIKTEQMARLADLLVKNYQTKDLLVLKASESQVKTKLTHIIAKNFSEEEELEQEARKMLASGIGDTREIDPYKMFLLLKQKLAQKKGFIL
jgi:hypothetical protein